MIPVHTFCNKILKAYVQKAGLGVDVLSKTPSRQVYLQMVKEHELKPELHMYSLK